MTGNNENVSAPNPVFTWLGDVKKKKKAFGVRKICNGVGSSHGKFVHVYADKWSW